MDKAEAALAYARIGWSVIPLCWPDADGACACPRRHGEPAEVGKAPLIKMPEGPITEGLVEDWWGRWPEANIGLLLGPSEVISVDADSREGMVEVERNLKDLGPTFETGRGRHYLFQAPEGATGRAVHRGECKDIDIWASGYIVLPPSKHRLGRDYAWSRGFEVFPQAPDWVMSFLKTQEKEIDLHLGDIPAIRLDDLKVSNWWRTVIMDGLPSCGDKYKSRSEVIFAVIAALFQAGHSAEQVAAVLLNDAWAVGDKLREKADPVDAAKREIGRYVVKSADESTEDLTLRDKVIGGEDLLRLLAEDKFEWLVDGLLPQGMLAVLSGLPKSGKTMMCIHLLKAVTQGGKFLGHQAHKAPVIYVNHEMHIKTLAGMYHDIVSKTPKDWPSSVPKPSVPATKSLIEFYAKQISPDRPGLIVIDSLRAAFGLLEDQENKAGAIASILRPLAKLAHDTNWAVLVVHHTNKNSAGGKPTLLGVAGSNEITGAADVLWVWQCGQEQTDPGWLLLDGRVHVKTYYSVRLIRDVCERVEAEDRQDATSEKVLALLDGESEGLSRADIEDILGIPERTVQYTLRQLMNRGQVIGIGDPKSKNRRYLLKEDDATPTGERV